MAKWNTDSYFEVIFHHFLSPRPDHSKIGEGCKSGPNKLMAERYAIINMESRRI